MQCNKIIHGFFFLSRENGDDCCHASFIHPGKERNEGKRNLHPEYLPTPFSLSL